MVNFRAIVIQKFHMGLHKMPSLALILHTVKKTDTEGYVYLRAGIPGTKRYVPKALGHKIPVKYWNDDEQIVKKTFEQSARINDLIEAEKKRVQLAFDEEYKNGTRFAETVIRAIMFPPVEQDDFILFYRDYVENIRETEKKRPATIAVWDTELTQFTSFVGGSISFRLIDTNLLNKYHQSLVKAEYLPTTIFKKLKKLRQIIALAIKQELIKPKQVAGFEMVKYVEPETGYLTFPELEAITKKLYSGEYDDNPTLRQVVAFFVVGCYSALRFSDWGKFKVEKLIHKRNFKVSATTKNNKPVYLPLDVFKSLATIVDYIAEQDLKFDLSEGKTNQYLKLIRPDLSTHDARRTFATLHGELGYSTRWIAKVMAVSERTAMGYIKATEQGFDNEISKNGGL